MIKGQKSIRGGIEDFLCPFTDMYITQGANGEFSHRGTMANDVRGAKKGVKYAYYAPCQVKCIAIYEPAGQSTWQSLNKVRFANGRVDYATFIVVHDDTQNCYIGQVIAQGEQLGNMGLKGRATGVHCHIQISQSNDTTYRKNEFNIYRFNNEYDTDSCYFVDNTNILYGMGGSWKVTSDVKVEEHTEVDPFEGISDEELAAMVWAGKFGNGKEREEALGIRYSRVQALVEQGVGKPEAPASDILEIGSRVEITNTGNGNSYGTSNTAYGIGWTREVIDIVKNRDGSLRPYPYRVGNASGTTGFYKKSSLKKK